MTSNGTSQDSLPYYKYYNIVIIFYYTLYGIIVKGKNVIYHIIVMMRMMITVENLYLKCEYFRHFPAIHDVIIRVNRDLILRFTTVLSRKIVILRSKLNPRDSYYIIGILI